MHTTDAHDILRIVIPIGAMIAALIVAGVGLYLYRRSLFGKNRTLPGLGDSNVLESLRHMRDNGEISDDEFQIVKQNIVAKAVGHDRADSSSLNPGKMPGGQQGACDTSKNQTNIKNHGVRRAAPGFDLTGEPLPEPGQSDHAQE